VLSADDRLRLKTLNTLLAERVEEFVDYVGADLKPARRAYVGACPIHGGSNPTGFKLYHEGHSKSGNWSCHTRGCENCFVPSLVGFAQGVLSHRHLNWSQKGDKVYPFWKVVRSSCDFVGQKFERLEFDAARAEKRGFTRTVGVLGAKPQVAQGWAPEVVRARLQIPSPYFLQRGLTASTLREWDVGDALTGDLRSPMYARAVVPVFDPEGRRVIGTTGRSLHPECAACCRWHPAGPCPSDPSLPQHAKWRHTAELQTGQSLFGLWKARAAIRETKRVVLVEGPADVMKCHQAGVRNVVGLYGVSIEDGQQILLESAVGGVFDITVLPDHDSGGDRLVREAYAKLGRLFRVSVVECPGHDPDEMTDEELRRLLA
jgi:5S rRNA maturation endonuclease (ribonuclease M5)